MAGPCSHMNSFNPYMCYEVGAIICLFLDAENEAPATSKQQSWGLNKGHEAPGSRAFTTLPNGHKSRHLEGMSIIRLVSQRILECQLPRAQSLSSGSCWGQPGREVRPEHIYLSIDKTYGNQRGMCVTQPGQATGLWTCQLGTKAAQSVNFASRAPARGGPQANGINCINKRGNENTRTEAVSKAPREDKRLTLNVRRKKQEDLI